MTPEELVAASAAPLNRLGAIHYFHPTVIEKAKAAGLDGMRMYYLGRGGVLGNVESHVIWGAFGYFNPAIVKKMWDSSSERMAPRDGSRTYLEWAAELGRSTFGSVEGLDGFNAAAAKVIAAVDPAGLTLYAGYAAEPVPEDAPAAAMINAITLRELRGSTHLLALVASGVPPLVAHSHRRPNDAAIFGWEELPAVSDADLQRIEAADELTNLLQHAQYSALSASEADAFAAGVDAMFAVLD